MDSKFIFKKITSKKEWESFNQSVANVAFFQSWEWGNVEMLSGRKIDRTGIYKNNRLIGIAQICEIKAKRGHFIHVRQGPVIKDWSKTVFAEFVSYIKKIGKEKGAYFVRMSPLIKRDEADSLLFKQLGAIQAQVHNQDAENRWVLDLATSPELLLSNMRKTTRYMIKKGSLIKITCSAKTADLDIFLELYKQTSKLKQFVSHSHIREEVEVFKKNNTVMIYLTYDNNRPLSGAIIIYYGREAIYHHGATSMNGRKSPASYALQWRIVQDAKKAGLKTYNLWGIAPNEKESHPWYGLSQFKKGFGGKQVDFIHAFDLPLSPMYTISYVIDYWTSFRKGYL